MTDDQVFEWFKSNMTDRGGFTRDGWRKMGIVKKPPSGWVRQVLFLARMWNGVGPVHWTILPKDKNYVANADPHVQALHKRVDAYRRECFKKPKPPKVREENQSSGPISKAERKRRKKNKRRLKQGAQQKSWDAPKFKPVGKKSARQSYLSYLESKHWSLRRKLMLKVTGGMCAKSGRKAKHVHHLTYKRLFQELPCDLMPLSEDWHKAVHAGAGKNALEKSRNVLGADFVDQWILRLKPKTWRDLLHQ